ncbi:hybrid sensor histidine kinase/response regulator [candidate division KSB1 bacterium]|nr:hybrid sensor histidine kinase/response regulator [candidate division KSB1 bacterium]
MKANPQDRAGFMQRINLIWVSVAFGLIYWFLEALREVIVYEKGTLLQRLFAVGTIGFWMRLLVVLVLVLFGVAAQSHRDRFETHKKEQDFLDSHRPSMVWVGLGFSALYWMLESVRDYFLFDNLSLLEQIFIPEMLVFWMRIMAICIMLLFSVYAQNLIDARKKMELALRETNQRLQELDRLKSEFLSTVSHELRTPIAIMREGVSLCMDKGVGPLNEVQTKLLSDTLSSIDRLNRLVTDLLDLSRIEEGKLKLRKSVIDMCQLANKMYEAYKVQAKMKNIHLNLALKDCPVKIYADEDKVMQIFNNLLSNAFRFTNDGGSITLHVINKGSAIQCAVEDTGIGISQDNIKKLFSKFEQVGRVHGPGYKGTGLGLAICKGLVKKHGGKIWAESKMSKGSKFIFELKKAPFPKILIVDDEPSIIEIIREFLKEDGYRLLEAHNGYEAVNLATQEKPAMIVLDMKLPGMNGYEIVGRLKQDMRTKDIPLIVISAFDVDQEKLSHPDEQAAYPVITKPFDRETLRGRIRSILIE